MSDLFEDARRRWQSAFDRVRQTKAPVVPLVIAVVLGLVLGLWMARFWVPEDAETAVEPNRGQLADGTEGHSPEAHDTRAGQTGSRSVRLGRCGEVFAAQVRPLNTVGPAMTQWEVHIGAMNKLVVGAITLAQARQFWNQTREGAARNLADFGDTQRDYNQRTARCPMPVTRASEELRACAAVIGARRRELDRAAVALDTWRTHVRHMEMLRRGEMSPEEATRMWLQSWREGSRQVEAYHSAARGVERSAGSHRAPCRH